MIHYQQDVVRMVQHDARLAMYYARNYTCENMRLYRRLGKDYYKDKALVYARIAAAWRRVVREAETVRQVSR